MPGMAMTSGLSNGQGSAGFSDRTVGTNSGPVGSFSANGTQPNGAMAYMLDGANLVDPGDQGTQIANINQDMTAEVKVLMSGYDAAYAKGPVVFEAFSKSGGSTFHGEAYFYARNSVFNSEDSYQRNQGLAKPSDYEYYPGGNIGGPVLLPWTHFNKNRDKLFFWFGYEYMDQHPAGTLWETFVPTQQMRAGNFTPAYLSSLPAIVQSKYPAITAAPCAPSATNPSVPAHTTCGNLVFPTGQIPTSDFDPNSLALLKLYPQPNIDPATHGGNNFEYLDQSPVNRWEQTEKIDYSMSENTKLTVSYARQDEKDIHPVQIWWAPPWSLPYPSPLVAPTTADVVMSNLTHVFSPTLTNETVFTYAHYINPISPESTSAINPATYGFNVPGLFGVNRVQIPNLISWSGNGGFAGFDTQAIFGSGFQGSPYEFGGLKSVPAVYDNLSKVSGTHTMKFGFYWDMNGNQQSSGQAVNGTYDFETYGGTTTGNVYADFLLGRAANYAQASKFALDNMTYHQYSLYGQDSWKVGKRLTLNYGIRFDHIGQWYDTYGGLAVFNLAAYEANPAANDAGLEWNAIDKNIPRSGFKSPLFYYEPRGGFAYDIFGNGKTVVRGGFAIFRYQISFNSVNSASEVPLGQINVTVPPNGGLTSLAQAATFPVSTNLACGTGCSISPLEMGDGRVPYTENYNFSIDEGLPGHSLFELSYVGNKSRDLVVQGTNSDFYNINMVPQGAFFGPDPRTGVVNPIYMANFPTNDYRPLQTYGDIWLVGHGAYANYNSLQAMFQKQSGPLTFLVNYTFGKVLGIRDGVSTNGPSAGNAVDPFNINANYGVLAFDHTQIFNAGYVFNLPSPIKGNWLAKGIINGWQLSGVTQLQSGAPLQPNTNGNMNASWGNALINGNSVGVSTMSWLGSNATGLTLEPLVTCDPKSNLRSGQYFNPNCFTPPPQGSNGTIIWPYIHGPAFFDSDLALFKNFKMGERQSFQFRFSAFNFLNHPNPQFGLNGTTDVSLNFTNTSTSAHLLSPTNTNAATNGFPGFTTGNRLVEFAIKYNF
jgi:hypothetical protein